MSPTYERSAISWLCREPATRRMCTLVRCTASQSSGPVLIFASTPEAKLAIDDSFSRMIRRISSGVTTESILSLIPCASSALPSTRTATWFIKAVNPELCWRQVSRMHVRLDDEMRMCRTLVVTLVFGRLSGPCHVLRSSNGEISAHRTNHQDTVRPAASRGGGKLQAEGGQIACRGAPPFSPSINA